MPDYKKRKVHRMRASASKHPRPKKEKIKIEFDEEEPQKRETEKSEAKVRVITGKKIIRRKRMRTFAVALAAILVVVIVLQTLLPMGIAETLGNFTSTFGKGSFPIELYGTEAMETVTKSNYFYVLTDSQLEAVSSGGKKIWSLSHGYASPILKTSETRAFLFDQNGSKAVIYNLEGAVNEIETETNILTAAIARNGSYAVATRSTEYASVVSVYDKKDHLLYEWYSATGTVIATALSPDGKKLAVATVFATDGHLSSKLLILDYDSADPIFTADFVDRPIYRLESEKAGITVCTENSYSFISWKKFERTDYSSDRSLAIARSSSVGTLLAFNRKANQADNKIVLFSKKGQKQAEFDFNGIISDIVAAKNHIYCISDTKVYLFDRTGKLISSAECGFGAVKLAVISADEVAVISNGAISRLELTAKKGDS